VTATAKDPDGNVLTGRPVTWEADGNDIGVVTIDQHGLVTGVTAGPITVVATVENVSTAIELTVEMDGPLTTTALGEQHSCGLATTGHIYCWGQNTLGQLGPDAAGWLGANLVASAEHFSAIAASGSHTCALTAASAAFCWGYNSFGQLGGTPSGTGRMVAVSGGLAFSRLAAGSEFTCGLSAGSAWCWGLNGLGQLGRGTNDLSTHTAPAAVVGGHAFTAIAAGDRTACGLTAGGQAWCWGSNETGQLGLGTQDNNPHSTPVHAAPALTFTAIAPGQTRTCGITTGGGVVQCWGGSEGLDPAPFDATGGYAEIAAGGTNFCRVDGGGTVFCWGEGVFPQAPGQAMTGVKLGRAHACARQVASGRTLCWGESTYAQLGHGSAYPSGPVEPLGQP
jgi:alpha-tubulin suppressor-like RCC1 family protein